MFAHDCIRKKVQPIFYSMNILKEMSKWKFKRMHGFSMFKATTKMVAALTYWEVEIQGNLFICIPAGGKPVTAKKLCIYI